jgi:soluble lytic murein transglycosylase-like protein
MIHPIRFLFLAILTGSAILIFTATLLAKPIEIVAAATAAEESNPDQSSSVSDEQSSEKMVEEEAAPEEGEADEESNDCLLPSSYPETIRQWCDIIQQNAEQHNIEPGLLAAVMLQESGGQANAYSASGAVGLMQIMPRDGIASTFQCINGPCFQSRPSMEELYDPEFNIAYGSNMLSNLFEKHGNWRDALKYYGPMNVGYYYADIILDIQTSYQ